MEEITWYITYKPVDRDGPIFKTDLKATSRDKALEIFNRLYNADLVTCRRNKR